MDRDEVLTPEEKPQQPEKLVASTPPSPRTADEEAEIQRVSEIWIRLYQAYGLLPRER